MDELNNVEKAKNLWTWFIGLAAVYQIALVIAICSGLGWSITSTVKDQRYIDKSLECDRVVQDFKEYKIQSDARFVNQERKSDERIKYLEKGWENCRIENQTMVKDAISDAKIELKQLKHQQRTYEEKLLQNAKR